MVKVAPFIGNRFQSAVPYYVEYRSKYPKALAQKICSATGVTAGDRILDLGCGPGSLTIDLALVSGAEVIGWDPDPAMLIAAREAAEKAAAHIAFTQASSYDLSPGIGPFKLVTMGRSFHWMDRVATLQALDSIIVPGGAVVMVAEKAEVAPENRWKQIVRNVQNRLGGDFEGGSGHHASVLLDSAFSQLEVKGIIERRDLTIDDIVGRAFSELKTSPEALQDRVDAFEATLRARLSRFAPSGAFREIVLFSALIARRPEANRL